MAMLFSNVEEEMNLSPEGKFIKENFLESCLNEDADEIRSDIIDLECSKNITMSDISNIAIKLEAADLNYDTNAMFLERLLIAYLNSEDTIVANEASYLVEYSGNEVKNNEFRVLLKDMEKYVNDYYDEYDMLGKTGDKLVDLAKKLMKCKDESDSKKLVDQMKNRLDDFSSYFNNRGDLWTINNQKYREYKAKSKTFNNKYSDVLMNDKKEFDKKLGAVVDKVISGDIKNWIVFEQGQNVPKAEIMIEAYKYIKEISRDNAGQLAGVYNGFVDYYYKFCYYFVGTVNYIRKLLRIEHEDTLRYKIIQKIIKSKGEGADKGFTLVKKTI